MKLIDIKRETIKALDKYVGKFDFLLMQQNVIVLRLEGNKQYKGSSPEDFYKKLDWFIGAAAVRHLETKSSIENYSFKINGTIQHESYRE